MQARESPNKRLRHGFHHARLARSRGPQKQQVPHRTSRRIQPRQKHLIDFDDLFDGRILPDNLAAQGGIKLSSIVAAAVRIQHGCEVCSHKVVIRLAPVGDSFSRPSRPFTRVSRTPASHSVSPS